MIAQGNRVTERTLSIVQVLAMAMLAVAAAGTATAAASIVPAGSHARIAAADATSRFVALGISKSMVIDLRADIKDVLVSNLQIANAVVRTSRRAYVIGVANIYFFDAEGRQIAGFDIAVKRDLNGLRAKRPEIKPADFAKALEAEPTAVIGFEPQLFGTAANNGQMVAEVAAGHKTAETFRQLAQVLAGGAAAKRPRVNLLAPLIEKLTHRQA